MTCNILATRNTSKASRRVTWCAHLLFHEPLSKVEKFHRLTILPCASSMLGDHNNQHNNQHQAQSTATTSNNKNNKNKTATGTTSTTRTKQQQKQGQKKNNTKKTHKKHRKITRKQRTRGSLPVCFEFSMLTLARLRDDHNASTGESNADMKQCPINITPGRKETSHFFFWGGGTVGF